MQCTRCIVAICFILLPALALWAIASARVIFNINIFILACIIMLLLRWIFLALNKHVQILKSGLAGEQWVQKVLAYLPKEFISLQNLHFALQGKAIEIDHLIVGPTGVFVIETKNIKGTIYGNAKEDIWYKEKIGKTGSIYRKEFRNPCKQVNRQVYHLSKLFKSQNIPVWIQAVVMFSHTEVKLCITDNANVAIFQDPNTLLQYILQPKTTILTQAQISYIKNTLVQK